MNIILIGMMGSGKSTIGKALAKKLNWEFCDSDAQIELQEKKTIDAIFQEKGESWFRSVEKEVLQKLCGKNRIVLSSGGGAPLLAENWDSFKKNGCVIWLQSSPQNLFSRLERNFHKRPLIKNDFSVEKIAKILSERETFYQKADLILNIDGLTPVEIISKILNSQEAQIAVGNP